MDLANDKLLTIREAAEMVRCCYGTMRKMLLDETIPSVQVGRRRRVLLSELNAFCSQGRERYTQDEVDYALHQAELAASRTRLARNHGL